jgi:anti-sigma factor ChrR (cupin superfamily)
MTPIHPDSITLNDYVDDALPEKERAAVDSHMASCASCREMVSGLRSVVVAVAALEPAEPPRAAWGRIEREIRRQGGGRLATRWRWLAAAAALVLATFAGLKLAGVWQKPAAPIIAIAPASNAEAVQAELLQALQHYQNAVAGIERIASDGKGSLDPETAATLEKNLAVVDQAISESRAALKAQPDSEPAQQSLLESFKAKIALLQDTVALIDEMRKGNEARIVPGLKQKGT